MRFDSSAEARSTTPWAEIDDIVCWNKCTLSRCLSPLARSHLLVSLPYSLTRSLSCFLSLSLLYSCSMLAALTLLRLRFIPSSSSLRLHLQCKAEKFNVSFCFYSNTLSLSVSLSFPRAKQPKFMFHIHYIGICCSCCCCFHCTPCRHFVIPLFLYAPYPIHHSLCLRAPFAICCGC